MNSYINLYNLNYPIKKKLQLNYHLKGKITFTIMVIVLHII